jgi:hypothetical protein
MHGVDEVNWGAWAGEEVKSRGGHGTSAQDITTKGVHL